MQLVYPAKQNILERIKEGADLDQENFKTKTSKFIIIVEFFNI